MFFRNCASVLWRAKREAGAFWHTMTTHCVLRLLGVAVGPQLSVRGKVNLYLHRKGNLKIGARCRINSGFSYYNAVGSYSRTTLWVGIKGALSLGNDVGISNSTIVCLNSIEISDHVFIGGDCKIYDTDFHSIDAANRLAQPDAHAKSAPIRIKSRAFIGGHSIILKGVTIGEEAVIGAGSVVTGNVPDGQIWAGNPARFIRNIPGEVDGRSGFMKL